MTTLNPEVTEGLEINDVKDGLVVYDSASDRVHYLNNTAAFILELCDGSRSEDDVAQLLAKAFELDQPPTAEVRDCLGQLQREGLVR